MNKIGSTRTITIKSTEFNVKAGLVFHTNPQISKKSQFKIPLDEVNFNLLQDWDDSILKGDKYSLARRGGAYIDYAFAKLKMGYDQEKCTSTDVVKSKIVSKKKQVDDLKISELNELLNNSKVWVITLRASAIFTWNKKQGIKYMVDQINID